jgi:hypothetical protein
MGLALLYKVSRAADVLSDAVWAARPDVVHRLVIREDPKRVLVKGQRQWDLFQQFGELRAHMELSDVNQMIDRLLSIRGILTDEKSDSRPDVPADFVAVLVDLLCSPDHPALLHLALSCVAIISADGDVSRRILLANGCLARLRAVMPLVNAPHQPKVLEVILSFLASDDPDICQAAVDQLELNFFLSLLSLNDGGPFRSAWLQCLQLYVSKAHVDELQIPGILHSLRRVLDSCHSDTYVGAHVCRLLELIPAAPGLVRELFFGHFVEFLFSDDVRLLSAVAKVLSALADADVFLPEFDAPLVVDICNEFHHARLYGDLLPTALSYCARKATFLDEFLATEDCIDFLASYDQLAFDCRLEVALFVSKLVLLLTREQLDIVIANGILGSLYSFLEDSHDQCDPHTLVDVLAALEYIGQTVIQAPGATEALRDYAAQFMTADQFIEYFRDWCDEELISHIADLVSEFPFLFGE